MIDYDVGTELNSSSIATTHTTKILKLKQKGKGRYHSAYRLISSDYITEENVKPRALFYCRSQVARPGRSITRACH